MSQGRERIGVGRSDTCSLERKRFGFVRAVQAQKGAAQTQIGACSIGLLPDHSSITVFGSKRLPALQKRRCEQLSCVRVIWLPPEYLLQCGDGFLHPASASARQCKLHPRIQVVWFEIQRLA